jgi:polyhydroxyalkanoate synthesis regulator phasin
MTLADIIQMQVDRRNGVMLSQTSINNLILHALTRECEVPKLQERIEQLEQELAQLTAKQQGE